ncbi:MAG: hydrogenase maturation peptidase HycI [Chloroflexota bacterium]
MTERPSSVTLVLGVGNVLKGDDAVGPYVAERIATYAIETLSAIDCGTVPENYTSVVRRLRPDHLVVVDAADMGLSSGSVRIVPKNRAGALGLSTHSMPLSMFMDYVDGLAGRVTLVGIQPETMRLGEGISDCVRASADALVDAIVSGELSELPKLDD